MTARSTIPVLLVALSVVLGFTISPALAATGETYSLSVTPGRSQESNSPGFLLAVYVENATTGATYKFTWSVTDPSGNVKNASNQTVASNSNLVLSLRYPNNFGTNINHVGNYTVNIQQNNPTNKPSVATGSFEVVLTDSDTYQRTYGVSVKARGYNANDNVTINLLQSATSAPGFPTWKLAYANGTFYWPWQIPPSLPTGTYTISLTGKNTAPKSPPDTQTITVYPTNATIPKLTLAQSVLEKTMTEEFYFQCSYLSGVPAQTGLATLRISEPDGVTSHLTTAYYDSTLGQFRAKYALPLAGQAGIWVATIDVNSFDDGFGNAGPVVSVLRAFTVAPATLTTHVSVLNQTYGVGDVLAVYATVTRPDVSVFDNGTVTARAYRQGVQVGQSVTLDFVQGQGKWAGSFQINATNPSGVWLLQVYAYDDYGSTGQGTTSAIVVVPFGQPPTEPSSGGFASAYWLVASAAIAAALAIVALFLVRRKVVVKKLKLDLDLLGSEASRIEKTEFFASVADQLKDPKDQEKPSNQKA